MKAVILAGGLGSRLSEETVLRPKPMVEVGGKPMLWHIMNIYAAHGVQEFIIALGYRAEVVKEYFLNFYAINNDLTVDLANGRTTIHQGRQPPWTVHLVDTGPSHRNRRARSAHRAVVERRPDVPADLRRRSGRRRRAAVCSRFTRRTASWRR